MRGASRASFAALTERLAAEDISSAAVATGLGDELFAVVGLLDTEHGLRRALSDPGKPAAEKAAVTSALLHGKISGRTESLVVAAAESRWATSGNMVDAIEQLAVEAMVLAAEAENGLDDLEDGLFRFGRVVSGQPELRAALASTSLPVERKENLLAALLRGKVTAVSLRLITQMVVHPRGRGLTGALDMCAGLAARRRQQLIAVVRSAVELSATQRRRLADSLAASYGHPVHLNVVVDPSVVGGISVQIGDELIDGTAASRLSAVRRKLAS
ncbi:MAG TPA: F0F1 ATP synthase subunit delta [Streptosporangiaceae bacterium]|nr:F0F1 ATP synthase subunit delta [Streptosporangiaceae bacterium]